VPFFLTPLINQNEKMNNLQNSDKNPKLLPKRKSGFTLVEIMIVVAIIGLLAAIAIPNFIKARATSQANACINNMRQIDGGEQEWALEAKQTSGNTPLSVATLTNSGYIRTAGGNSPTCPAGGSYSLNTTLAGIPVVTCSIGNSATPAHVLK
jgi:prepilin-type N-terminal cleavage/methylation domain-containing protein